MKKPFLGCAYYPEDWDDSQLEFDISMMKKAGISCARIAEFAWRKMEPREGDFQFGWLHRVVDALGAAGISVVMGTPTATPPIWLSKKYPDVLRQDQAQRVTHGGRRHCCSVNPHYLDASRRIVEALGREFGKDPNIIGWQIDNEILSWFPGCLCEHCVKYFHERLRREYGTIEELNRRWDLNLFSQAYDDFDEIPPPNYGWHNPHIILEWNNSHYDSDIAFIHMQADILRKYTTAPIGTDMMPTKLMDYEAMNEKLDVVQFNHYNTRESIHEELFWFDHLRTLKERPFWNTETATNWNGSTCIYQVIKPEGFCRVNSWLPVALGGECNMYWLWRQHWAGHELMHGAVLTPEGRPMHIFGEVQQTAAEFEKASDFLAGTKVVSDVAVHFSSRNFNLFNCQPVFEGNNYSQSLFCIHRVISACGTRPDVIGVRHSLDGYKVIFSPLMMTLEENDLADRIKKWVENGGVWVAGPMTDVRDDIGAHYLDQATGIIEKWLGVRLDYALPTDDTIVKVEWKSGGKLDDVKIWDGRVRNWIEAWNETNGEALASITEGHSALIGKSVIVRLHVGKGEVILCGTKLADADMKRLAAVAFADAGVIPYKTTGAVVVSPRKGQDREGLVVCETGFANGTLELPRKMTDILTGCTYEGTMQIAPYGVYVLV